jgi:hypothetical protein
LKLQSESEILLRSGGITEEDLGIERILEEVGWNFGGVLRLVWKFLGRGRKCVGEEILWRGGRGGLRQSISL